MLQCVSPHNKDIFLHNHKSFSQLKKFNIDTVIMFDTQSIFKFLLLFVCFLNPFCLLSLICCCLLRSFCVWPGCLLAPPEAYVFHGCFCTFSQAVPRLELVSFHLFLITCGPSKPILNGSFLFCKTFLGYLVECLFPPLNCTSSLCPCVTFIASCPVLNVEFVEFFPFPF